MTMLIAIIAAIFILPVVGLVFLQRARAGKHRARQEQVWGPIAARYGSTLSEAHGFQHCAFSVPMGPATGLVSVLDGEVVDKAIAGRHRSIGGWHTHIDCAFAAGTGFSVDLRGRELARGVAPAELARVWSERVASMAERVGKNAWLISGGNHLTLIMPGVVLDGDRLEAGIELVRELVTSAAAAPRTTAAA